MLVVLCATLQRTLHVRTTLLTLHLVFAVHVLVLIVPSFLVNFEDAFTLEVWNSCNIID